MDLRREPALLWVALIAPVVQVISALLWINDPALQGWVNAAAVAVAGAITAALVRQDQLVPAILAAVQALMALAVGLGLAWTPEQQAMLMVPLGAIAGVIVRTQVLGPVDPTPARHAA